MPSFDYQKKRISGRKKNCRALLFKMLKLRVLDFFFTEINVFVITQRVKYWKGVPLGTGTELNNNVELCSDWLFHSAAHFSSSHSRKETQGGKYIFQYFLSQLYRRVIILYIKCGHQGATINMLGIETAFKWTLFILWSGSTYHTFYKIRCLSVVLRICKSFAIILSHLSWLCLCGKRNLMYCNVTGYR